MTSKAKCSPTKNETLNKAIEDLHAAEWLDIAWSQSLALQSLAAILNIAGDIDSSGVDAVMNEIQVCVSKWAIRQVGK